MMQCVARLTGATFVLWQVNRLHFGMQIIHLLGNSVVDLTIPLRALGA